MVDDVHVLGLPHPQRIFNFHDWWCLTQGIYCKARVEEVTQTPFLTRYSSQVLDDFINNPRSLVDLLASSLPQQSTFFINYLLVAGESDWWSLQSYDKVLILLFSASSGFGRLPLKLFRIPAFLRRVVTIILCRPVTEREVSPLYCLTLNSNCHPSKLCSCRAENEKISAGGLRLRSRGCGRTAGNIFSVISPVPLF